MEILSICSEKGVKIFAIKGNWHLDGSMQSKIMAMVFSMASEIERDLISKRTKEALAARKRSGGTLGRPKGPGKSKLDPFRMEIEALLRNGATQVFVAKRYHTSTSNLRAWMKNQRIREKNH